MRRDNKKFVSGNWKVFGEDNFGIQKTDFVFLELRK